MWVKKYISITSTNNWYNDSTISDYTKPINF